MSGLQAWFRNEKADSVPHRSFSRSTLKELSTPCADRTKITRTFGSNDYGGNSIGYKPRPLEHLVGYDANGSISWAFLMCNQWPRGSDSFFRYEFKSMPVRLRRNYFKKMLVARDIERGRRTGNSRRWLSIRRILTQ